MSTRYVYVRTLAQLMLYGHEEELIDYDVCATAEYIPVAHVIPLKMVCHSFRPFSCSIGRVIYSEPSRTLPQGALLCCADVTRNRAALSGPLSSPVCCPFMFCFCLSDQTWPYQ